MLTGPRLLVVDNYDSFVYNIVQYVGEKYVLRQRMRAPLGEPVLWSGYATDGRTALQAALERPS